MHKELNPELFGERRVTRQASEPSAAMAGTSDSVAFLNVDRQILELRQGVAQIGEEMRKMGSQMQEFMKSTHLRTERLQQQVQRLEQSHNGLVQETSAKMAQIGQRLGERKAIDQKIQEMVDRHTSVIKSFEVRMHHLQRLLQEKEAQLVGAQATLNETKMEIARLKRL